MTIIYATDFSPSALPAARVASQLARRLGDTVVVAHVVEVPSVFSSQALPAEAAVLDQLERHAAAPLAAQRDALRAEGLSAEARVLRGRPDEALARLARECDARLVVVGSHGRSALGRLFLGAVAERLVRLCPRPVLVVPPVPAGALASPGPLAGPLHVLVALDRGAAGGAAVAAARGLRQVAPCDLTFLHLYDPSREQSRLGLDHPGGPGEEDPDLLAVLERELRPIIAELPGTGRSVLRLRPAWGGDPEPLTWEANMERADLIIVGVPPRRSASTAGEPLAAIRAASIPVLAVPVAAEAGRARPRLLPPARSILAATDFSDAGNAGVLEAYRLLRGSGGVVELCHVVQEEVAPLAPERWAGLQRQLWSLVPQEAATAGVVTRVSVLEGRTPGEAIVQAAERMGCDAVALGSPRRPALQRALLGSVADQVVGMSNRTVMLVRTPSNLPMGSRGPAVSR